ncbi:polyisoprenoid-binding protein YceI [Pedobacter sp. AK017]|uniref:YceI family protein n=1 Tax=Pedobacter sp. AK017 TaxID=2723073 RepID=UPI00160B3510|nr:YceI family protein [Pedobacter sp. AK017]MBB5440459.1 polyisoprenoid-binding protein YceI [Pedobacter sp. AK017]
MSTNSQNESHSQWEIDPLHSELIFKTKYLLISTLSGYIRDFSVNLVTIGSDFGKVTDLRVKGDLNSLSTGHVPRDEHLKSKDFFDTELHPQIEFDGIFFEKQGMHPPSHLSVYRRDYKLRGKLTIKGISKLVLLEGEFGGMSLGTDDQKRAGFTVRGEISREEFGLTWKGLTTAGKVLVSDEVTIVGNLQLVKKS